MTQNIYFQNRKYSQKSSFWYSWNEKAIGSIKHSFVKKRPYISVSNELISAWSQDNLYYINPCACTIIDFLWNQILGRLYLIIELQMEGLYNSCNSLYSCNVASILVITQACTCNFYRMWTFVWNAWQYFLPFKLNVPNILSPSGHKKFRMRRKCAIRNTYLCFLPKCNELEIRSNECNRICISLPWTRFISCRTETHVSHKCIVYPSILWCLLICTNETLSGIVEPQLRGE